MNRLILILFILSLPTVLSAATLADPPKDTGISFVITKLERFSEDNKDFDLLTVRVENKSKAIYWIKGSEKDPVEMFSRRNPEALDYLMVHSYTTDHEDHHHVRKEGNWKRTHPLHLRIDNGRWIKIGPGDKKEFSVPIADTLVNHAASIILGMFFSRDSGGQDRFYLVSNAVIVKAQQVGAGQPAAHPDSKPKGGQKHQPESEERSR